MKKYTYPVTVWRVVECLDSLDYILIRLRFGAWWNAWTLWIIYLSGYGLARDGMPGLSGFSSSTSASIDCTAH